MLFKELWTDGRSNGRTDGLTDGSTDAGRRTVTDHFVQSELKHIKDRTNACIRKEHSQKASLHEIFNK